MSYSGANQYSPYYQAKDYASQTPASRQQPSGSLYQDQSRVNGSYSTSDYQPLSAYQSQVQQPQQQQNEEKSGSSSYGRSTSYNNQSYGGYTNAHTTEQNLSSSYATTGPDTSPPGNLAYASRLGQSQDSQPSLSQIIDHNRARGLTNYRMPSQYGNAQDHQRTSSGAQSAFNSQQTTQSTSLTGNYQTTNGQSYQAQDYRLDGTGRSSPAQHPYVSPQQQQQRQSYGHNGLNNYALQPARPASGQAISRPHSSASNQGTRSPQVSSQGEGATSQYGGTQTLVTQQQSYRPTASTETATQNVSEPPAYNFLTASSNRQHDSLSKSTTLASSKRPRSGQGQKSQPSFARTQGNAQIGQQSPHKQPETPTTVDPSHVFNQFEYQRRLSDFEAARKEAEASKGAYETAMTGKQRKTAAVTSTAVDDVTQAAQALMKQSALANSDTTTKEQIEAEMKAMIEKMRDYKAKEPNLFSQVWEEVKKVSMIVKEVSSVIKEKQGNAHSAYDFSTTDHGSRVTYCQWTY